MASKDLVRDLHAKLATSVDAKSPASQAYKNAMRMVATDLAGDLHAGTPRANEEHDAMSPDRLAAHLLAHHHANEDKQEA